MTTHTERRLLRDISLLPEGQRRAVTSLVGGERARTYVEASEVAHISVNTLYTHLRRVKSKHPKLYEAIYRRRRTQLRGRHNEAVLRARETTPGITSSMCASGSGGCWVDSEDAIKAYKAVVR